MHRNWRSHRAGSSDRSGEAQRAEGSGGFASHDLHELRGQAYLAGRQGQDAALEFQKILDNRGVVLNSLLGALAHERLAEAYVLQGDTNKARSSYEDFFALWKDADTDIPILQQAKTGYAKLH